MASRPAREDVLWMTAGAVILAAVLLAVWFLRRQDDPAQQLAFKATRVDLVGEMELSLSRASEAEKSAVLAIADEDSRTFAGQARAATAEVEGKRQQLAALLETGGTQRERDLLAQFSQAFGDLQRIDEELLRLAVRGTNLKAYALLFGPAADALAAMDDALARVVAKATGEPDARQVLVLAFDARIAVLRIQVLLAPHIAEESDPGMDRMEASMREEEARVRKGLDALAALPRLARSADLAAAAASFGRYEEVKGRILALSRENTNVRSLALSLDRKRKAVILCLDSLGALKQAVLEEPVAGLSLGRPLIPR